MQINIYEPCNSTDLRWCKWEEPPSYAHETMPDLGRGGFKIGD